MTRQGRSDEEHEARRATCTRLQRARLQELKAMTATRASLPCAMLMPESIGRRGNLDKGFFFLEMRCEQEGGRVCDRLNTRRMAHSRQEGKASAQGSRQRLDAVSGSEELWGPCDNIKRASVVKNGEDAQSRRQEQSL